MCSDAVSQVQALKKSAEPRVLIVGAGIAGLTLAQALHKRGIAFDLIDKVECPAPVGAGIALGFNVIPLLDALGLGQQLRERGQVVTSSQITTHNGSLLQNMQMPAGHHARQAIAIHRADLHDILAQGLPIGWDTTITTLKTHSDGINVTLNHGEKKEERKYALVLGADGLHSWVRQQVFGAVPLRYAGYTCWRWVCESPSISFEADTFVEQWLDGRRLGHVNMGQGRHYMYVTLNAPEGKYVGRHLEMADLCQLFPKIKLLEQLKHHSISLIHNDLYELSRHCWQHGRVALLGDAAHALTPNLGQGAGLGIEDAIVLAEALYQDGLNETALVKYADVRRSRVQHIANRSRQIGLMGQLENTVLRQMRDLAFKCLPQHLAMAQTRKLLLTGVPQTPK